ncbi:hypothetical protein U0070_009349, partial [Myodes glareolus]
VFFFFSFLKAASLKEWARELSEQATHSTQCSSSVRHREYPHSGQALRSFKLKFKFKYSKEGSNTKPNHSEKPSDCPKGSPSTKLSLP